MTDILDELQWRGLLAQHTDLEALRLPVQLVVRPQGALSPELASDDATADDFRDYRAFAGRIERGHT